VKRPAITLPHPSAAARVRLPGAAARSLRDRLATLARALDVPHAVDPGDLLDSVVARLDGAGPEEWWLTAAVLTATLPEAPDVVRSWRTARVDGPAEALDRLVRQVPLGLRGGLAEVEVVTGEVLVDLAHTSRTELATGIQRVARLTAVRWHRDHDVRLVGWRDDGRALRPLTRREAARALHGSTEGIGADRHDNRVVVPWRATYLLPELAPERDRTRRLLALARFSRSTTGVIGFDCVPVSSAETTDANVSEAFINNLAAVRHFGRVAAISRAAAGEYEGWRHMLSAIGEPGPDVVAVDLPVEPVDVPEDSIAQVRSELVVGDLPVVLCVGTHEPRKNHLAVLHAAEVLWRRGRRFSLAFVGGHSWNSARFDDMVSQLRAAGRPVETLSGVSDARLWAAYRVSHCLVFPSLNEGFGLPVAEALASGTPVVTSGFGSMAEIARHGGAVLVDPRDDDSLVEGLDSLLVDEDLYDRLRGEARDRPGRSWDDYARETWDALVDQGAPRP